MKGSKEKTISIAVLLLLACAVAALAFLVATPTRAEIPQLINYQSRLRTRAGAAVASPTAMRFSLYTSLNGGAFTDAPNAAGPLVWSEVYDGSFGSCGKITPDAEGYFTVQLGSCEPFPAYITFTQPLYLGIAVEADSEAVPRLLLATFPYAFNAGTVGGLRATSSPAAGQLLALDSNLNFNINTGTFTGGAMNLASTTAHSGILGSVSIGTSTQNGVLTIQGSGSGNAFSILGVSGSETLTVTALGRVGIGTSTPGVQLAVAGNLQVTGATILNGISYTWPSAQGGPGTFLANDGNGLLTWSAVDSTGTIMPVMGEGGSIPYYTGGGYALSQSGSKNQLLVSQGASSSPVFLNLSSLLSSGGNIVISGTTTPSISVSNTPSFSSINGISLSSLADGFTISGGSTGRSLTVTGGGLAINGNGHLLELSGDTRLGQDLTASSSPVFNALFLTNPLPVTSGGTGARSFIAGGILYGTGDENIAVTTAPSLGQIFIGTASSVPGFVTMSGDATIGQSGELTLALSGVTAGTYGTSSETLMLTVDSKGRATNLTAVPISGVAPGGAAGGDLSGSFPNPTVSKIGGWGLGDVTPTDGNLLIGSGPIWVSRPLIGDASIDSNGMLNLSSTAVTAGRYGNATTVPYFTVDGKGRVTSAGQNAIAIDPSQLTETLPVMYGGTGATFLQGILKGNGTASLSSLTGISSAVARWTDQYTLGTGALVDTGSLVGVGVTPALFKLEVGGNTGPSVDNAYNLGSNAARWMNIYGVNMNAATATLTNIYSPIGQFYWSGSSGRLGLGTSNPTQRLSVEGNISLSGSFMPGSNAGAAGDILVSQGAGNSPVWQGLNQALSSSVILNSGNSFAATKSVGTSDNNDLALQTNGVERMRILASGNIGIGTQNPTNFMLQSAGSIGPDADNQYSLGSSVRRWSNVYANQLTADTVTGAVKPTGFTQGPLAFGGVSGQLSQDSTLVWNSSLKRLGVGTSTPSQALSISGNAYLSGALMPAGNAGTSGFALVSQGADQAPVWQDVNAVLNAGAVLHGGNSFSTTTTIGTLDNYSLAFTTNGSERLRISQSGNVGVGTLNPSSFKMQIAGNAGPDTDNAHSLGSPSKRWANVYATNYFGNITPTAFSQGPLVFGGVGGVLAQVIGLYWDEGTARFGVGTTTPGQRMSVDGNFHLAGAFMPAGNAGTSGSVLVSQGSSAAPVWQDLNATLNSSMILHGGNSFSTTTTIGTLDNYSLAFTTNGSERLRISQSGNVGVGTSTPAYPLQVYASGWNSSFGSAGRQVRISDTSIGAFSGNLASSLTLEGPLKAASLGQGIVKADSVGNLSSSAVSLGTADVTGVLPVNRGGLGLSSYTPNGVLYAYSTTTLAVAAPDVPGQLFAVNSSGVPSFVTLSGDASMGSNGSLALATTSVVSGTYGGSTHIPIFTVDGKGRVIDATSTLLSGIPPGGLASGDLAGSFPEPIVQRINGSLLGATSPTSGNILIGSGTAWETKFLWGDATLDSNGVFTLSNTTVASGTYGSLAQAPVLTVDSKGRITAVSNTPIQVSALAVTSGTLPVARGGTGAASFQGILKGNGTSSLSSLSGIANAVARWTDQYTLGTGVLFDTGSVVSVGTSSGPSLFNAGSGNGFQVNDSGDVVKINNLSYTWPTVQGLNHTYLRNDGNGNLTWVSASGGVSPVNNGVSGRFAYYAADGTAVSDQGVLSLSGSAISVAGTLSVTATSTLSSLVAQNLIVSGSSSLASLSVSGLSSFGAVSAQSLSVSGTTTLNSIAYTWPSLQGTTGQVLTNNGSGVLSWTTVSAGSGSSSGSSLWTAGTNAIYAATSTSDNVGIGTSTPGEKLVVAGNIAPALTTQSTLGTASFPTAASLTKTGTGTESMGSAVSSGDINGDGYPDLVVGAYRYNSYQGHAYIYYGGPSADSVADVTLTGEASSQMFGGSVSASGDVNGDGYKDVVVGADNYSSSQGRVYIFYGGRTMSSTIAASAANVIITGEAAGSFGIAVSSQGDINNDGYADVIVGAYSYSSQGRAYVFYGGRTMSSTIAAGSANVIISAESSGDQLGSSVASGDINNDGYRDIYVGAYGYNTNQGRAYVFYGSKNLATSIAAGSANLIMTGAASSRFGSSIAAAGDMNGDGYSDLLIGAFFYNSNQGRAYVYFGGLSPDTVADVTLTGEGSNNYFGVSADGAGDINGDGYQDILVGAHGYNSSQGRAYVFYGGRTMSSTIAASAANVTLTGEGGYFGISTDGVGDINGDGYPDILIGARDLSSLTGKMYVYYGAGSRWKGGFVQSLQASQNVNIAGLILDAFGLQSVHRFGITTPAWSVNRYGSARFMGGTFMDNLSVGTTSTSSMVTLSGGAHSDGATWSNASDESLKENFATLDPVSILEKISSLSIKQWNYKGQASSTPHIGPTAQDFFRAFGLGGSDTSISTVDPSGVALLGIQALDQKITALQGSLTGNVQSETLTVSQPAVYEKQLAVKGHLYLSEDSIGEAKILAGSTEVRINFKDRYQYQPIVTMAPRGEVVLEENFRYAVVGKDESGFTIKISRALSLDVEFDWHAFASETAKLTVSDGSVEGVVLVVVVVPDETAEEEPLPAVPAGEDNGAGGNAPQDNDSPSSEPADAEEPSEPAEIPSASSQEILGESAENQVLQDVPTEPALTSSGEQDQPESDPNAAPAVAVENGLETTTEVPVK